MLHNMITISCQEYDKVNDKIIKIDHKMTYEHYDDFVNPCYVIQDIINDMRLKLTESTKELKAKP